MSKLEEKNVEGGESVLLHLDDWEFLQQLSNDPVGNQNFTWGSPKSKNIDYKVGASCFSLKMKKVWSKYLTLTSFLNQKYGTGIVFATFVGCS